MTTTLNIFMKTLLLPSLLALVLWSCSSPLDTDTPRTITPLTPAPKVKPVSINSTFNTATGSFVFKGTPKILVDTTSLPMRFWVDFSMENVPDTAATAPAPVVVEYRVKVDSFPGDGFEEALEGAKASIFFRNASGVVEQANADLNVHMANMLITERLPRVNGERRKVTLYLSIVANKNGFILGVRQDQVYGFIELEI